MRVADWSAELPQPVDAQHWLATVKQLFGVDALLYTPGPKRQIQRIALCGGAGEFLIDRAAEVDADLYLTGEIGYHHFSGTKTNCGSRLWGTIRANASRLICSNASFATISRICPRRKRPFAPTRSIISKHNTPPLPFLLAPTTTESGKRARCLPTIKLHYIYGKQKKKIPPICLWNRS